MPFQYQWLIEGRVVYARAWGERTVEEIEESSAAVLKYLEEGKPLVHVIRDETGVTSAPANLGKLKTMVEVARHPAMGWIINIGESGKVTDYVSGLVIRVARARFRKMPSVQEAMDFLLMVDSTLDRQELNVTTIQKFNTSV